MEVNDESAAKDASGTVMRLTAADAHAYQSLRLLGLQESPSAFSAGYEEEVGRSIDEVAQRIAPHKDDSVRTFGIFDEGELAGILTLIHPQREKMRHSVQFVGMYIAPKFRRRGLAGRLLRFAIAQAASIRGIRQIKLSVTATNATAKALYKSAGFELYGVEPDALCVGGTYFADELLVLRIDRA
jgi:ribosomal protein S18 acetylase RimI-like enzyme